MSTDRDYASKEWLAALQAQMREDDERADCRLLASILGLGAAWAILIVGAFFVLSLA